MVRKALLASSVILALALFSSLALAQIVPPHRFYGTAKKDGAPVPAGTVVSAWIDNEKVGETTSTGTPSLGFYRLDVEQPAGKSFAGKTVVFKVADLTVLKAAAWEQGGLSNIDLEAVTPPPTPTPTPTP